MNWKYNYVGADVRDHPHVFNAISGYCECGLQYCPHLEHFAPNGGSIGGHRRSENDPLRFVTRLWPGDSIAPERARIEA